MVAPHLEHLPERHVRVVAMPRQVRGRQAERVGLDLERRAAAAEGVAGEAVDLADLVVGHGVAADRQAVAVDHQEAAAAAVRAVEGVGIAEVDRQMIVRVRVHLRGRDRVKTLRRLAVAFVEFRAEIAGPAADRIGLEMLEAAGRVLLPDLEFRLFLEDAHHDRRELRHPLALDQREQRGGQLLRRLDGQRFGRQRFWRRRPGRRAVSRFGRLGLGHRRRQANRQHRRPHQRMSKHRADHGCRSGQSGPRAFDVGVASATCKPSIPAFP